MPTKNKAAFPFKAGTLEKAAPNYQLVKYYPEILGNQDPSQFTVFRLAIRCIERHYASSTLPDASRVVDCCIYLRESLR